MTKTITRKQFGDAGEHLVISYFGFNNIPCAKMPDNWPGYDLIAQPHNRGPVTISVKTRAITEKGANFFNFNVKDQFEFIAFVQVNPESVSQRIFIVPRAVAMDSMRVYTNKKTGVETREAGVKQIEKMFKQYENKFDLIV